VLIRFQSVELLNKLTPKKGIKNTNKNKNSSQINMEWEKGEKRESYHDFGKGYPCSRSLTQGKIDDIELLEDHELVRKNE